MGKSLRSKTKRTFRAKKREDSVYAAVHAARLNRLNSKLKAITQTDKDGDFEVEGDGDAGAEMQGSSQGPLHWPYVVLGLLDPAGFAADTLASGGMCGQDLVVLKAGGERYDATDLFPHLFADSDSEGL